MKKFNPVNDVKDALLILDQGIFDIVYWVKSKGSREVMITSEDGSILHTKDCSASQVKKLLPSTVEIAVIDTQPSQTMQHNKAFNAGQATEQIAS